MIYLLFINIVSQMSVQCHECLEGSVHNSGLGSVHGSGTGSLQGGDATQESHHSGGGSRMRNDLPHVSTPILFIYCTLP